MNTSEIKSDLKYSKMYLEDLLGNEVVSFSIPFNLYSPFLFKLINEVGYKNIYFNSFFRSQYYPKQYNIIQRKQIFKTSSIKSIKKYLESDNCESFFLISYCSFALVLLLD